MTDAEKIALAKELFGAYLAGNFAPIFEAVTDDVTVRLTIPPGTPLSGVFTGRAGLQEYFGRNAATVETIDFQILNYLAGDNQIAVTGRETLKVRHSGQIVKDNDWIMLCTLRGDKISDILIVEDPSGILHGLA